MSTTILSAAMGREILKRLQLIGDLPAEGIVAGQSVVSAIMDLSGENIGVYNDIDIFRIEAFDNPLKKTGTVEYFETDIEQYRYSAQLATKHLYSVAGSYRQDMVNIVPCAVAENEDLTAGRVLAGFDLNCVQAGIDLRTGRLSWTPAFEQFWKTRQIELTTLFTPYSSIIRAAKKMHEIKDVYCDVERSCAVAAALGFYIPDIAASNRLSRRGGPQFRFGKKARSNFLQYASVLEPYFTLTEALGQRHKGLWTLLPKPSVENLSPALEGAHGWGLATAMPSHLYSCALREGKSFQKKAECVKDADWPIVVYQRKQGAQRYLAGQVSPTHVEVVTRFLDKHPATFRTFGQLPLARQYTMVGALRKEIKNRGEWVVGAIEEDAFSPDLTTEEAMQLFLDDWEASMTDVLVDKALRLPKRFFGWTIKELVTHAEMIEEGKRQNHCVGGYARSVKNGRCRIVSLRHSRHGTTTMELYQYQGVWRTRQHRAAGNNTPSREAQGLEILVKMYLNGPREAIATCKRGCKEAFAYLWRELLNPIRKATGRPLVYDDEFDSIPF